MKLFINGYEVNISAKRSTEVKCSQKRTCEILNELATFCSEASDSYTREHLMGLSAEARRMFNNIYDALDEVGWYDNVK